MTVAALATVFLADHKATWSASWYGDVRWYLDEIVLPAWGGRLAKDITRREVKDLVKRYAVRAPVAANMCFRAIRKMFRWASREEYLDGAPMVADLDEPTKTGTGRDRVLSPDEVRAVWIALAVRARRSPKAGRPRAVVDLWRLRLLTAQRETALRSIRWTWVNVEAGTVEFPARVMKRKMQPPHVLPLGPLALRVLRRRRAFADPTDLLVFGTRRGETRTPGLTKGAPLALPDFQGKDLRRTAATLMAEHGVTDFDISRVLNHARKTDEGVTGIYNKYRYLAEKRRALETLDRVVSTILHPTRRAGAVVAFKRA
jgi:integrase